VPRKLSLSKNIDGDHRQIFNHIANFENYSSYIPGCTNAKLLQKEDKYEVGELEFNFLLKSYSIKSKNLLSDNTIFIKQIEGPFESFDGEWKVSEIDNHNTEVTFKAEFQLPFLLNNLLPDKVIDNFCKVAIEAFVDRVTKE
jgi:ribosome-associated toxin RatA of RatAB toxin-antitoxin module|tara:strand:- start:57 stop:482 length:426 start_codon:yes stop_codon:yes gene_type:complete